MSLGGDPPDATRPRRAAVHYLGRRATSVASLRTVPRRKADRRLRERDEAGTTSITDESVGYCVSNALVSDEGYAV